MQTGHSSTCVQVWKPSVVVCTKRMLYKSAAGCSDDWPLQLRLSCECKVIYPLSLVSLFGLLVERRELCGDFSTQDSATNMRGLMEDSPID